MTAHQRKEVLSQKDRGEETLTAIARSKNVSHSIISRLSS
jgi:hypothetical protein